MLVILATLDAEIERLEIGGQPREIIHETTISKITRIK
jgi:hypothetical protein